MKKAIILLSGGLDSTVLLALALSQNRQCIALSFDYQQTHRIELHHAKKIAAHYQIPHHVITLDNSAFGLSSLVTKTPPQATQSPKADCIPPTYVPARNTLFLAFALSQCELHQADEIYIGANRPDRENYPDCRVEYLKAFQNLMNLATKQAIEAKAPELITPFIELEKVDIIRLGLELKAPLELSWSCYFPTEQQTPCDQCLACVLRHDGFAQV